jgi:hypothetical protein
MKKIKEVEGIEPLEVTAEMRKDFTEVFEEVIDEWTTQELHGLIAIINAELSRRGKS